MKTRTLLALGAMLMGIQLAGAQGTGFTYQGRLNDGTNLANGYYDMRFLLSDGPANPIISSEATNSVPVSDGLFTVVLDLGANFPGADRWLEIQVKTNGGASYSVLTPRQKLTPTPYAIYAGNAAQVGGQSPTNFVAKAGDTMTGKLNLPADGLTVGGGQLYASGGNWAVTGNFNVDAVGTNNGALIPGLTFGSGSGEGISSKRTSGGNHSGLDFYTGSQNRMSIANGGKVGIGTMTPGKALQVGDTSILGSEGMIRLGSHSVNNSATQRAWDIGVPQTGEDTSGAGYSFVIDDPGAGAGPEFMIKYGSGDVGIGTTSPQAKLDVNGDIKARNLPGLSTSQSSGSVGTHYSNEYNATVDSITFNVPAKGVLLVSAFVHTAGSWDTHEDFKLLQASVELAKTTSGTQLAEHTLFWVIPVSAAGSISFQTVLWRVADQNGSTGADYFAHNLTAVYLPVQY